MNHPTVTRLDLADAASEARAVLEAEHGYDAMSLAERVGALEWHLGEMLAAVAGLAAE